MPSPITTPGYRYATQRYPLDGVETDFEFNFTGGYIAEEYVTAYLQDVFRVQTQIPFEDIEFIGPNQVRIASIVDADITDILIIRRDTPKDLPLLDFTDGAILNDRNLNKNTKQAIHGIAEMVDLFADMLDIFYELNAQIIDAIDDITQALIDLQILIDYITNLINEIENINFLTLADTPDSYVGKAGNVIVVNDDEDGLIFKTPAEIIEEAGGAAATFLELEDTPDTYVGQGGKYTAVNDAETALEFKDVTQIVTDLIDEIGDNLGLLQLNDTPDTYAGQADKFVKVKGTEDGVEFVNGLSADGMPSTIAYSRRDSSAGLSFVLSGGVVKDRDGNFDVVADQTITLTDDSVNYLRAARTTGAVTKSTTTFGAPNAVPLWKITTVAGVVTEALDYRSIISLNVQTFGGSANDYGLLDVPFYAGNAGKILACEGGEESLEYIDFAFTGLTDAPTSYTGEGGKFVKVNVGETGLEFADAPVASYLGLSDTDPTAYTGFAGFGIKVNSGETGTNFGRFLPFRKGNTTLGGNARYGVWCDPNGDGSMPADGSTNVDAKNDMIIATKTTLVHPTSGGYGVNANGTVGFGSFINHKGMNNVWYGSGLTINARSSTIIGSMFNAGNPAASSPNIYESIIIFNAKQGASRGIMNSGTIEQRIIAIGDGASDGNQVANEKNTDSVRIGFSQSLIFGSSDGTNVTTVGNGAGGTTGTGNYNSAMAYGGNSPYLYGPGTLATNHHTSASAADVAAAGYIRFMFSRRTTQEFESLAPNTPYKGYVGGASTEKDINIFTMLAGTGAASMVHCIRGFATVKNRPGSGQPDCTIWKFELYCTSGLGVGVILSQSWTRGEDYWSGVADPVFAINAGTGLLEVQLTGAVATTLHWCIFAEAFNMG